MEIEVKATKREPQGTGASRRMRRAGRVPGIVYGGNRAPQPIELDHNDLYHQLKQEAFHASILRMDINGATEQVLLRDVQMHPFRQMVLHVDFQRVAGDQKIHVRVPLHFINEDTAPGVKLSGGVVNHVLNELDVTCRPADLPEFIEVDMAELDIGHSIHLSQVKFPEGVEPVVHGEDPVLATIQVPRGAVSESTEEAAPSEGSEK